MGVRAWLESRWWWERWAEGAPGVDGFGRSVGGRVSRKNCFLLRPLRVWRSVRAIGGLVGEWGRKREGVVGERTAGDNGRGEALVVLRWDVGAGPFVYCRGLSWAGLRRRAVRVSDKQSQGSWKLS